LWYAHHDFIAKLSDELDDEIASGGTPFAILCLECYTVCSKYLAAKHYGSHAYFFLVAHYCTAEVKTMFK